MEPHTIYVNNEDRPHPAPPTAQQILTSSSACVLQQVERLSEIQQQQIQYLQHPSINTFNLLVQGQSQLHTSIVEQFHMLSALEQQFELTPPEIDTVRQLKQDLHLQIRQLEVYQEEARQYQHTQVLQPVVTLAISKQPFPMIVRKGKQINEDQLEAKILTGAYMTYALETFPSITATLLLDSSAASGGESLENNSQKVDSSGVAQFPLKFLVGTRKSVVHIKFAMSLHPGTSIPPVESELSNAAIIITNECQWEGSLGMLMKRDAFGGKLEITWYLFANTLQHYFLIATKQAARTPRRPLSTYDFQYIHAKFFGNRSTIKQPEFDAFWQWFGKIIHLVRFQKHICALYLDGLIYGLMNRESTHSLLQNNPIGTFFIRFSERHPGQLDIVFLDVNNAPNHYLVKPTDISGPMKFPDFLAGKPSLTHILRIIDAQPQPMLALADKATALQQHVTQRAQQPQEEPSNGYVPTII